MFVATKAKTSLRLAVVPIHPSMMDGDSPSQRPHLTFLPVPVACFLCRMIDVQMVRRTRSVMAHYEICTRRHQVLLKGRIIHGGKVVDFDSRMGAREETCQMPQNHGPSKQVKPLRIQEVRWDTHLSMV